MAANPRVNEYLRQLQRLGAGSTAPGPEPASEPADDAASPFQRYTAQLEQLGAATPDSEPAQAPDSAVPEEASEEEPGFFERLVERLQPERRDYPHDAVAEQQAMRDYAANYIEGPTGRVLRGVSQQEAAGDAERRDAAVRLQRELMEQGRGRIEGPTGSRPRDTTPPEERDPRIAEQSPVGAAVAAVSRGVGQMVESTGGFVRMLGDSPILPMPPENQIGETIEAAGRRIRTAPSLQPSSDIDPSRVFDPRNPSWWLERGLEQAPQLAASIGLAVATGGFGTGAQFLAFAAPTFVQETGAAYQESYRKLRERGANEATAQHGATGAAVLTGVGAAALERIPYSTLLLNRVPGADRIFANALAERIGAHLAARVGTTMVAEGLEEVAQEAWGDAVAYAARTDPAAFEEWRQRYAAAGALGTVTGAGAAVVTPAVAPAPPAQAPAPSEAAGRYQQQIEALTAPEPAPEPTPQVEPEPVIAEEPAAVVPEIEPAPLPAAAEAPSRVAEVPVSEIDVEPDRFQFKIDVSSKGVGRELESVRRWDPNLAGLVQVWVDPADGRMKVINGHHRLDLAQRLGVDRIAVRFIEAETDAEARTIGALTNIAEGRGTALDAAKLFRDQGIGPADLEQRGISLRGAVARDGLALAQLAQPLFQDVVAGRLPVQRAAVIGSAQLSEPQQLALVQMLAQREARGRRLPNEQLSELIRFVRGAGETSVQQETLFGEEQLTQSLAVEKSELSAWVKDRLAKDRRLFGFLARGGRAGRIEEEGAGAIDTERALSVAGAAAQAEEVYHRLSTMSGPVSDALNEAAQQLAQGGSRNEITQQLYERVRTAVETELAALTGGQGAGAGRVPQEPAGRGRADEGVRTEAAAAPEPAEAVAPVQDPDQGALLDIEVQDDLFGGPAQVTGEQQRDMFGAAASPPSLSQSERQARATVDRLRPLIERDRATPAQREQYREALALVRRGEAQSEEETRLRATGEGRDPGDTGELFGPMLDAPAGDAPQRSRRRAAPAVLEENPAMTGESVEVAGRTLHPIAPVELARIAAELLGGSGTTRVFLKRYPGARGAFYPDPSFPRIGLNPQLGQDYDQFARTLAHEVGHLIDFLPNLTMNRGNILGRLATLKGYLSETIDRLPSDPSRALTPQDRAKIRRAAEKEVGPQPPKDEEADLAAWREEVSRVYAEKIAEEIEARDLLTRERVHEELHAVSMWWRPYSPGSNPHYDRYRQSSPEIFADVMSVLLNDPAALQQRAPIFFDSFLAYSDRKPELRMSYDAVQALIGAGEDALMAARREELERDFERGEEIQREVEERPDPQSIGSYLKQLFVERGAPLTDAERRRVGRVPAHSEERAVRMALQEHQHADNVNRLMLMDISREVHEPMLEAGITPEQAGRFLMLQRIAEGDRGGMAEQAKEAIMELTGEQSWPAAMAAYIRMGQSEDIETRAEFDPDLLALAQTGLLNPRGYTPAEAKRTLAALETELGAETYAQLEQLMGRFRAILFQSVETAVALGSYNAQVYAERILPNRATYTPFAVLDYFNGRVPAGVKAQIGTLKGIANPYTSALMKAMALNRLNEFQRVKLQILKVLDVDFPGMAGAEQRIDKFHREKRPGPGRENLLYLRDGKLFYREVDAYIAKVLEQSDLGAVGRLARAFSSKTYGLFHPLYVTWSLGWQARNIQRDWKRTFKNLAAAHAGQPTYRQALGAILDVVRLNRAYARTMGAAWRNARREHDPLIRAMLRDRALGRAFHSFEPNLEAAKYERLLQQYGIKEPTAEGAKEKIRKIGRVIETLGIFQETWSKAAAYELLGEAGFSTQERAYIVRNYIGTPDSTQRGLASDAVNGVMLYANVIMAGLRADAEVALQPQTAAGYWLRSVMIDFVPKTVMAAALAGFFGDELEEWMRKIPSYDLEKYLVLPWPPFWSENQLGERKAVYMRLPHDDVNRILTGTLWALLVSDRPHRAARSIGLVSGEFGGLNPALSLPYAWFQVARGKNPEDTFRGRPIVPPTQWEAGGWQRWKELLRYTLGEFGIASELLGFLTRATPDEARTTFAEAVLRSIPGVSSLIKVSNRGESERRDWEIEWERQQRAKLRADLSREVRSALGERAALNRLGEARRTPREQQRRQVLNAWYRRYYLPLTAAMEQARDTGDRGAYDRAKHQLEERAREVRDARVRRPAPAGPR